MVYEDAFHATAHLSAAVRPFLVSQVCGRNTEMVRAVMHLGEEQRRRAPRQRLVIRRVDGSVEQADLGPSVKDALEIAVGHSQLASKPKRRPAMLGMSMADKAGRQEHSC